MAMTNGLALDRNLALECIRVTEAAALSAAKWVGKGDNNAADQAAVNAMRRTFDRLRFRSGTVQPAHHDQQHHDDRHAGSGSNCEGPCHGSIRSRSHPL